MRNSMKVAKWEVKRNMKNKSFIISLFLTPLIFLGFAILPGLLSGSDNEESVHVYVKDELGIASEFETMIVQSQFLNWDLEQTDLNPEAMLDKLKASENTAYIPLTKEALESGIVNVYTSEDLDEEFANQARILEQPLKQWQIAQLGLSPEEMEVVARDVAFKSIPAEEVATASDQPAKNVSDPLERLIPGAFAGIILFSIVITGMMIFQSASQEKKDKIAEIILSSLTPGELMQGKIIGYFVLGLTQVFVWLVFAIPFVIWKFDIPVMEYLFVPELAVLLFIAVAGYLLFASIFVGIGATIEDVSTSGNFQGFVLMIPFVPFILIGPILSDPSGLIAQIGSYIPLTSPGVLLVRLSIMDKWPWTEIIISLAILLVSVWLFMKLAGKIFKTGILMYGKNATPKEIWKWIWA